MNILIADDLYTNRIQIGIAIKSLGFDFDQAENGEVAIEMLKQNHYDLILMDIEMPVRNGLETTRYIRTQFSGDKQKVPVFAITAHNPDTFAKQYKQCGFDGLISKPVTREKLQKITSGLFEK